MLYLLSHCKNKRKLIDDALAQWIRLRLQSCHPKFESQAHRQNFHLEKTKIDM